jgi:Na+/H+ antiporter NhaC
MRKPYHERAEERDNKRYESMKKAAAFFMCVFLLEVICVLSLVLPLLWDSWVKVFIFVLAMLLPFLFGTNFGTWIMTSEKARFIRYEAVENKRATARAIARKVLADNER